MKDVADKQTPDILTGKRPVGRPPKPDALTPAEKQKRYRDRKRAEELAAKEAAKAKELHSDVIDLSEATPVWRR